jgi:hypothetical protein
MKLLYDDLILPEFPPVRLTPKCKNPHDEDVLRMSDNDVDDLLSRCGGEYIAKKKFGNMPVYMSFEGDFGKHKDDVGLSMLVVFGGYGRFYCQKDGKRTKSFPTKRGSVVVFNDTDTHWYKALSQTMQCAIFSVEIKND